MNSHKYPPTTVLIITLILSCQYAYGQTCVQPPSGLVSWWPGDGNAQDIIGGNSGTITGNVTFAAGNVGQAFSFVKGSASGVVVPSSASLNLADLTIEAWVNVQNDGAA